jgi:hypothetical protein
MLFDTQLAFVYRMPCSSLKVEKSTLAYEANPTVDQKVVSGILYPYKSDKTNAKKLEISIKIDVYSYRRPHRHTSCSAGVICRGCGVVTCNTQPSIY